MIKEHNDGYCAECLQYREERDFTRHSLLRPTPKVKKCNFCHEKHEKPINKVNRASITQARFSKKVKTNVNHEFTLKRRKAEIMSDELAIAKEFEL